MTGHMQKAINIADRVISLAEDGLRSLELTVGGWPPEYRAIIWKAVADIATRRAADAKKQR